MKAKIDMSDTTKPIITEVNKSLQLTNHFTIAEMANLAGDSSQPQYIFTPESSKFMLALELFRSYVGGPVRINSGYRQPDYNHKIGGNPHSAHLCATAADIQPDYPVDKIIKSWFKSLDTFGLIGAVNVYPERNYYHLEAYSDIIYAYDTHWIRVYSNEDLKTFKTEYGMFESYLQVSKFTR